MSVEQIKHRLASLSAAEQEEVSAFLFHLRHAADPETRRRIDDRLADKEPASWLTPEEFERRLDQA